MSNDDNVWELMGSIVGDGAGRVGESSGGVVDDYGYDTTGIYMQEHDAARNSTLEQKLQAMVDRFVTILEKENWKDGGYYISDVFACESYGRAQGMAKRLAERASTFRRGLILISIHVLDDGSAHVHTIHSCPYANRSCRCYFKAFPEAQEDVRRLLRKPPPVETFKRGDWENITKYFCTKGRRATFAKVHGAIQGLPLEITNLSNAIVPSQDERPFCNIISSWFFQYNTSISRS